MSLILTHWKKIVLALALVVSFGAGYWSNTPESSTKTSETSSETSSSTETKNNDKIKVVTQKPDGSIEVVEIDKSKKTKEIDTTKDTSKTKEVVVAKSKYRTGVWVENKLTNELDPVYSFELGMRAFGNFWLGTGINTDKEARIGISYEW